MKRSSHPLFYRFSAIAALVLISGCATHGPLPTSDVPVATPAVTEVQSDPARFKGTTVRWGGVITRVDNQPANTWIEVVSHELQENGQPQAKGGSSGRFIAVIPGFADPAVYTSGRKITVVGTLGETTTRQIGEYNYTFPLVNVSAIHLWPVVEENTTSDYPPPWWYYDPWPYYPRPYPYRNPRYRW